MSATLACPHDHRVLAAQAPQPPLAPRPAQAPQPALACEACGRSYPVEDGVVRFLAEKDQFYEGHYADWVPTRFVPRSERFWHAWPLWLIKSGYLWALRRHVPAGGTVVEVGCGSGVVYFGRRWRMVGVDLAVSSLTKVVDLYDTCVQADLGQGLPLPDGSADAIANSFLWEHIEPAAKPAVLADFLRVLKPGGKLVLLYDVHAEGGFFGALRRRQPDLYQRLFVEGEHHWGMESAAENRAAFERAGFRVLEHAGKEKTLVQSPWVYDKVRRFDGWPGAWARLAVRFAHKPWLQPWTALVRGVDEFVGPWLPEARARKMLTVCEKPR